MVDHRNDDPERNRRLWSDVYWLDNQYNTMVKGQEVFALEKGTTVYYRATVLAVASNGRIRVHFHGGKMRNLKLMKDRQCNGKQYRIPSVIVNRSAEKSDGHKAAAAYFQRIKRSSICRKMQYDDVPSDDDADSDYVPILDPPAKGKRMRKRQDTACPRKRVKHDLNSRSRRSKKLLIGSRNNSVSNRSANFIKKEQTESILTKRNTQNTTAEYVAYLQKQLVVITKERNEAREEKEKAKQQMNFWRNAHHQLMLRDSSLLCTRYELRYVIALRSCMIH